MTGSTPAEVEIIAVRKNSAIALLGCGGEGLRSAPGLNDDVFRDAGDEHFIPTDHGLSMFSDNPLHALAEIGLKILIGV